MKKTYRIQNTEKKKTKTNNRRESFKVKDSELSPASSPVKKNKVRDLIPNDSDSSDEFPQSENEESSMGISTTNGLENKQNKHTLTEPMELCTLIDGLKIDPTLLETNEKLKQENLELKNNLEVLQSKFDKLLAAHRKAKLKEKEEEATNITAEEVTDLYAQLEQAKTKLFHFKDPNRASQKGILKKSVTFNEVPEIHDAAEDDNTD